MFFELSLAKDGSLDNVVHTCFSPSPQPPYFSFLLMIKTNKVKKTIQFFNENKMSLYEI